MDQDVIGNERSQSKRCDIYEMIARNKAELENHIKHVHKQGDCHFRGLYSKEQKLILSKNTRMAVLDENRILF
jgi:hypothetical protein